IYAAGFMLTRSADAQLSGSTSGLTPAPVVGTASTGSTSGVSTPVVGASTTVSTLVAASTSTYANGTYTGQGTSRRGGVSVAVTIQGGAIANVQITGVSTEYPVSRIA